VLVQLSGDHLKYIAEQYGALIFVGQAFQCSARAPSPPVPSHWGHTALKERDAMTRPVATGHLELAAEAMNSVSPHAGVLTVKTAIHDSEGVLVSIEDSGTGVDPENLDRIFEAFFTTKSEGMGMGLAICRSLIEAHDGRLWASSGVRRGSVFNVLLPTLQNTAKDE